MSQKKPYKTSKFKIALKKIKNRFKKIEDMTPKELQAARIRRRTAQYDWNQMTVIFALSAVIWMLLPIVRMHVKIELFGSAAGGVSENLGFLTPFNKGSVFYAIKDIKDVGSSLSSLFGEVSGGLFGSLFSNVTSQFNETMEKLKGLIPYAITSGVLYIISLIVRLVSGVIFAFNKKTVPCIIMQTISLLLFTAAGGLLIYITGLAESYMPTLVVLELTLKYGIILQYATAVLTLISVIIRKLLKDIPMKS